MILCTVLCLSLLPAAAFAEEEQDGSVITEEIVVEEEATEPAEEVIVEPDPAEEYADPDIVEETVIVEEESFSEEAMAARQTPVVVDGTWGNLKWKLYTKTGELIISGNGKMNNFSSSSTEAWREYKRIITSVEIGSGVTSIGEFAFYCCGILTSVTIPESVTSIGDWAFSSCYRITSITIPESVTSIGECAFNSCSGLTSVTIPKSVTAIREDTFSFCGSLTSVTIPESVTSIGMGAFESCSMLTNVTIPKSVTDIREEAFSSCRSLTSVTIPESVTYIGDLAFGYCKHLEEIRFLGAPPQNIGVGAFEDVIATAYYPANKGWNVSDKQDYGGILEWEMYDSVTFDTTLNLADYTGIYVYIGLPEGENASEYTVQSTYQSYRQTSNKSAKLNTLPKGSGARAGMYKFEPLRAASTELSDTVTVTLKKDGAVVKTEEYSVRGIAEARLAAGEVTGDTATLHRALLQYGRYGQLVFGNKTDDLPGTEGAPALVSIPARYAAYGDPTSFGAYVTKFESKLDLNSAISMNLYLTLAKGYSMDRFYIRVLDQDNNPYSKYSVTDTGNNRVRVRIEGILSPQLARNFRVVVTLKNDPTKTATWTRSVLTCAYETQQTNTNLNVKSLMQALYQYYVYAARVFPQFQ